MDSIHLPDFKSQSLIVLSDDPDARISPEEFIDSQVTHPLWPNNENICFYFSLIIKQISDFNECIL